jgi:SIR2-like domain
MSQPDSPPDKHDEPHYKLIINAIKAGGIVPFLGSGVNLCDRPNGMVWTANQDEYMPSGTELAEYLTDKYQAPGATIKCSRCNAENPTPVCKNCHFPLMTQDLPRVSQYIDLMTGSAPLYDELHQLLDKEYHITDAHHFFARLPSLLREKGYYPPVDEISSWVEQGYSVTDIDLMMLRKHYSPPLLIVTTNYDDLMERAFTKAGEAFDLLWYAAHGEHRGKLLHKQAGSNKVDPVDRPKEYDKPLLIQHPVILKIHGAVKRGAHIDEDSYVITEDHYIDYLTHTEIANLLPARLVAKLRKCHFLFLGYALRDWNLRVILHRISGEQKLSYKSWAIQRDVEELDRQFWSRRNVDLRNESIRNYISDLDERLRGIAPMPALANISMEENHE